MWPQETAIRVTAAPAAPRGGTVDTMSDGTTGDDLDALRATFGTELGALAGRLESFAAFAWGALKERGTRSRWMRAAYVWVFAGCTVGAWALRRSEWCVRRARRGGAAGQAV